MKLKEFFDKNLEDMTFNDFLEIESKIKNNYFEISNLLKVLKVVRNNRLITNMNYTDSINQFLESFKVMLSLSSENISFQFTKKEYAITGFMWECMFLKHMKEFDIKYSNIRIIHIPSDVRVGKRIEISFNMSDFKDYFISNSNWNIDDKLIKKLIFDINGINKVWVLHEERVYLNFENIETLGDVLIMLKKLILKDVNYLD